MGENEFPHLRGEIVHKQLAFDAVEDTVKPAEPPSDKYDDDLVCCGAGCCVTFFFVALQYISTLPNTEKKMFLGTRVWDVLGKSWRRCVWDFNRSRHQVNSMLFHTPPPPHLCCAQNIVISRTRCTVPTTLCSGTRSIANVRMLGFWDRNVFICVRVWGIS